MRARRLAQRIDRRDGHLDIAVLDESAKATKLNRISDDIVSLDLEPAPPLRLRLDSVRVDNTTLVANQVEKLIEPSAARQRENRVQSVWRGLGSLRRARNLDARR